MKPRFKYLLLLGLLPGMTLPAVAQLAGEPPVYDKEKLVEQEVTVGLSDFKLPGTLTLPVWASAERKVPCIILVHGSGPNDRDETLGPNKPFRDLAWALAERGIATLRYDKRTKVYGAKCVPAGREIDYDVETVDDAVAIIGQMNLFPEIDTRRLYLLGHSLGGLLLPRIAQRASSLSGLIYMAALARGLEDALMQQVTYIATHSPHSQQVEAEVAALKLQVDNVKKLGQYGFDERIPLPMNLPASYWMFANNYKPLEVVSSLGEMPMLFMQGERDYQVTMMDMSLWKLALMSNLKACFRSYPKLNHLFGEGEGISLPAEYMQATPVPTYVADDVARFVNETINQ